MKVKDYRMLIEKKPKYRARITKACPACWNELIEVKDLPGTYKCTYCMDIRWDKKDEIITFHSKNEQLRGAQLKALEKKGLITGLERQVRFNLFPAKFICNYNPNSERFRGYIYYDIPENYPGVWGRFCFADDVYLDLKEVLSQKNAKQKIKILEKEKVYILDFQYTLNAGHAIDAGRTIFEDFKGFQTRVSKAKIALFEALYGVKVLITTKEDLK